MWRAGSPPKRKWQWHDATYIVQAYICTLHYCSMSLSRTHTHMSGTAYDTLCTSLASLQMLPRSFPGCPRSLKLLLPHPQHPAPLPLHPTRQPRLLHPPPGLPHPHLVL